MANQVPPGRGSRPRRQRQRRARRRVELVALTQTTRCGAPKRPGGLGSLFRIGLLAALLLAPMLFAAGTLAGTVTLDPPPDSAYWTRNSPQTGGNPLHSGHVDIDLMTQPIAETWRRADFEPFLAGPVMDRDNAYVVDRNGTVAALNLTTGDTVWRFATKTTVSATPALAYGWLYVATEGKTLIALSARTGTEIASTTLAGIAKAPPTVAEGRVFQGNDAGTMQVFDATTLDELWTFDTKTVTFDADGKVNQTDATLGKPIRAPPAVYDGKVYLAGWNKRVYAMTTTGNNHGNPQDLLWTRTVSDLVNAAPAVDRHRDHLIVATAAGQIEAMRLSTGLQKWTIDAGGSFHRGISVSQERIIAATSDGRLLAADPYGGAVQWEHIHEAGYIAAPVLTETAVVGMTANGTLHTFAPASGDPLKQGGRTVSWQLPSGSHTTPAMTSRGLVAVDQSGVVAMWGPPVARVANLVAGTITPTSNLSADAPLAIDMQVTNRGPDASGTVDLVWALDDGTTGKTTIDNLANGATHNTTVMLPPLPPGTHTMTVTFTSGATDPSPDDATASLPLTLPGASTLQDDAGTTAGGDAATHDDNGHSDADARVGLVAGFMGAWSGWMVPVSLIAAAGGVAGMRNRTRIMALAQRLRPNSNSD